MQKQLIIFSAAWCGPCKMYKPTLNDLKDSNPNIEVTTYDVEEDKVMAEKFNVRGVPTTIYIDEDGHSDTKVGALSRGQLNSWLRL